MDSARTRDDDDDTAGTRDDDGDAVSEGGEEDEMDGLRLLALVYTFGGALVKALSNMAGSAATLRSDLVALLMPPLALIGADDDDDDDDDGGGGGLLLCKGGGGEGLDDDGRSLRRLTP